MDDQERHPAVMRTVIAVLRLAADDPQAATVAPLSQAQTRVLRYLPTHPSVPEIAGELCVPDRLRCPPGPRRPARHGPAEDAFPGDALTVRPGRVRNAGCELEVLRLAAAGRGDRDIARELSISPKTAGVPVPGILAKLGVSTRTEAAATVHRMQVPDGRRPRRP
jgi:DNA-binding CsgD family transcriptional regulator